MATIVDSSDERYTAWVEVWLGEGKPSTINKPDIDGEDYVWVVIGDGDGVRFVRKPIPGRRQEWDEYGPIGTGARPESVGS